MYSCNKLTKSWIRDWTSIPQRYEPDSSFHKQNEQTSTPNKITHNPLTKRHQKCVQNNRQQTIKDPQKQKPNKPNIASKTRKTSKINKPQQIK